MKVKAIFIFFLTVLLIGLVSAEDYSLDPCGETQVYEQGSGGETTLNLENNCIALSIRKTYNPNQIILTDKINQESFKLNMMGIEERQADDTTVIQTIPFDSMGFSGFIDEQDNSIYWTNGDVTLGYRLNSNRLKGYATIQNYVYDNPTSNLWIEMNYKVDVIGTLEWLNPEVDGVVQPNVINNKTSDNEFYYFQKLGHGNLIILDPAYTVDHSPIPASYLIGGFYRDDPDYDYTSILDITSEMSDGNPATYREIYRSGLVEDVDLSVAVKFEETSGNISKDYGFEGEDVILYNSPNLNVVGASGSGIDFDGTDDYGIIPRYVNLTADQDVVFCLSLFSSGISATESFVDNKGGGNDAGFEFTMTPSDTIDLFVRRGAVQTTISGTINVADSTWHKACGVSLANGTVELWLDGTRDVFGTGITGVMETTKQIYVGATDTLGNYYSQTLDEVCAWKGTNITQQNMIQGYNDSYCGNPDGNHIAGNWNITYDANYTWYLKLNKISNGTSTFSVTPYIDSSNVSQTISVSTELLGTGVKLIAIDSLMDYITNTINLTYTKLRLSSLGHHNISEIYLMQSGEDNITPSINYCYANTTSLDCGETSRLTCNITDDFALETVLYQINDTNYSVTQQIGDFWHYDFAPTGVDVSEIYDWQWVFATDFANNTNITDPNILINYTCFIPCVEDWVANPINCLINDTYLLTYYDNNSCGTYGSLPGNNGTYQSCNYCSEDLQQVTGACQPDNTQNLSWTDNNYFTCCDITGLSSDCSILESPFNETTDQFCHFFDVELGVLLCQEQFDFGINEKEYCLAEIPINYSNESFKCIAYVVTNVSAEIIQTNPEYRERAVGFLNLFGQDPETRTYFTPINRMVNVYITKKNIDPDHTYFLHVQCNSDQRTLESVHAFSIGYENLDFVFYGTRWIFANTAYIIIGLIVGILILGTLFLAYKRFVK